MIDEQLTRDKSYESWKRFSVNQLLVEVLRWPTMTKMTQTLSEKTEIAIQARRVLQNFLHSYPQSICISTSSENDDFKYAKYLAAEGALIYSGLNSFRVPNMLVMNILLHHVIVVDYRHRIPIVPVPRKAKAIDEPLDIAQLIQNAIEYFDWESITKYGSFKTLNIASLSKALVPREICYHTELFIILRQWLSEQNFIVTFEHALPERKRADLVIKDKTLDHYYVLELVANDTVTQVQQHFQQALEYKAILKAQEAWVIHFTVLSHSPSIYEYPWPTPQQEENGLKVVHIWHTNIDQQQSQVLKTGQFEAKIWFSPKECKEIKMKHSEK